MSRDLLHYIHKNSCEDQVIIKGFRVAITRGVATF